MKELARRLAEDLRHAAVMFSHHEAAASTARPAAAGLAVTLEYGQPTRKRAARRRGGSSRAHEIERTVQFYYFLRCTTVITFIRRLHKSTVPPYAKVSMRVRYRYIVPE